MTRLPIELERLYLPLHDPAGVRTLVLELGAPADWDRLSKVWVGVQADLELPAPGIAVSGIDAMQLWFSLQQPVDMVRAQAFLDRLQARYLVDVAPARVRRWPASDALTSPAARRPWPPLPPVQVADDRWAAFVAADLAPLFVETPWLDLPPSDDGQAGLLVGLASIEPSAWTEALHRLRPAAPAAAPPHHAADVDGDPVQFLRAVMADPAAPLALRVEAAKALLPYRARGPLTPSG